MKVEENRRPEQNEGGKEGRMERKARRGGRINRESETKEGREEGN